MILNPNFTAYTRINSKWIKYLNISAKMIKLLEKIIVINHYDHVLVNGLRYDTKSQPIKNWLLELHKSEK